MSATIELDGLCFVVGPFRTGGCTVTTIPTESTGSREFLSPKEVVKPASRDED